MPSEEQLRQMDQLTEAKENLYNERFRLQEELTERAKPLVEAVMDAQASLKEAFSPNLQAIAADLSAVRERGGQAAKDVREAQSCLMLSYDIIEILRGLERLYTNPEQIRASEKFRVELSREVATCTDPDEVNDVVSCIQSQIDEYPALRGITVVGYEDDTINYPDSYSDGFHVTVTP